MLSGGDVRRSRCAADETNHDFLTLMGVFRLARNRMENAGMVPEGRARCHWLTFGIDSTPG
jgi:hypothetical protein